MCPQVQKFRQGYTPHSHLKGEGKGQEGGDGIGKGKGVILRQKILYRPQARLAEL